MTIAEKYALLLNKEGKPVLQFVINLGDITDDAAQARIKEPLFLETIETADKEDPANGPYHWVVAETLTNEVGTENLQSETELVYQHGIAGVGVFHEDSFIGWVVHVPGGKYSFEHPHSHGLKAQEILETFDTIESAGQALLTSYKEVVNELVS